MKEWLFQLYINAKIITKLTLVSAAANLCTHIVHRNWDNDLACYIANQDVFVCI